MAVLSHDSGVVFLAIARLHRILLATIGEAAIHRIGCTIPLYHNAVFGAGLKDVVDLVLRSGFGGVGRSRSVTFVTVTG